MSDLAAASSVKRSEALHTLAAAALTGCAQTRLGQQGGTRHSWTVPHTLRWSDGEELLALNPLLGGHSPTVRLSQLWAAWLFRYDMQFEPVPELATVVPSVENGLLSEDGLRIVFKLRDAVWSDGVPFTSRDVAASVSIILDPKTNVESRDGCDRIERVETPDARTAVFHMKETFAGFVPTFFTTGASGPCILPAHIVTKQDPNRGPYNDRPVGIGPFVVDSWEKSVSVRLSANQRYWRGRPKLEHIEYKIIPSPDTVIEQLRTHELDLFAQASPHFLTTMQGIDGIKLARCQSTSYRHLDCNCAKPPLTDVTVRRALNYAIDRDTIVKKVFHGVGTVNWSPPLLPSAYAYNHDVARYPFDLALANQLLESEGWVRAADGGRSSGGTPLRVSISTISGNQDWSEIVELVRSTWQQIGVTVESRPYPEGVFFGLPRTGGVVFGGRFDVCGFSWGGIGGATGMIELYGADMNPPAGQNVAHYRNSEVTRLLSAATHTLRKKPQAELLRRAQKIIADECPVFPIVQNVDLYALNDDVTGFRPVPSGPFEFMMDVDV